MDLGHRALPARRVPRARRPDLHRREERLIPGAGSPVSLAPQGHAGGQGRRRAVDDGHPRVQPKTGVIAATSSPAGIALHAYAESDLIDLPATGSEVVDRARGPRHRDARGGSYAFDHWSDGSTDATHTVPVVAGTTTLKATFRLLHTTDAANSCAAAPLERRGPEWRAGRLWNAGDVDWYRFSMAATGTIRVRLGDLPVGRRCGSMTAARPSWPPRSGTASEEMIRTLPAGTYAVKVTPTAGGSMTPYALQIARLGADLSLQSATSRVSGGTLTLSGEVWNDRSSARGPMTVTARLSMPLGRC